MFNVHFVLDDLHSLIYVFVFVDEILQELLTQGDDDVSTGIRVANAYLVYMGLVKVSGPFKCLKFVRGNK